MIIKGKSPFFSFVCNFFLCSGVWHFRSSQREIPNRGLLCEPDLAGASVSQLCPVPALHSGWEEVGRWRIPLLFSLFTSPVGKSSPKGLFLVWTEAGGAVFCFFYPEHTQTSWICFTASSLCIFIWCCHFVNAVFVMIIACEVLITPSNEVQD